MATYLEQSIKQLKEFEGSIPWMYLDTVGKVTVGVGLMLVNELAAHALPFMVGDRPADKDEVEREFERVRSMKKGLLAKLYLSREGLRLPQAAIDRQLEGTLTGFEGYLRSHIRGYDQIPEAAKLALLDMIYNLGPGRLFSQYTRLIAAVESGDWKTAAAASNRRGPSAERNAWTKQQFLNAGSSLDLQGEAEASRAGVMLWGLVSGVAAAIAVAVFFGELDRIAARRSKRSE